MLEPVIILNTVVFSTVKLPVAWVLEPVIILNTVVFSTILNFSGQYFIFFPANIRLDTFGAFIQTNFLTTKVIPHPPPYFKYLRKKLALNL